MKYNNNQIKILKHTKKRIEKKGYHFESPYFLPSKTKEKKKILKTPFFLKQGPITALTITPKPNPRQQQHYHNSRR
ncbi:hypothetical protein VIGAN_05200300 [Vigna angularis var. angularis]|uniref:Uncharacterized protein n=1 Tax=Vigna angularis var. angularis TaxID=157739 RepID=A0A0S3S6R4_PHAAN|nr:hypothetical protein VIGAN_05200300 [Vigna angularis var. angularis]